MTTFQRFLSLDLGVQWSFCMQKRECPEKTGDRTRATVVRGQSVNLRASQTTTVVRKVHKI